MPCAYIILILMTRLLNSMKKFFFTKYSAVMEVVLSTPLPVGIFLVTYYGVLIWITVYAFTNILAGSDDD
jgi:hypothetical protein